MAITEEEKYEVFLQKVGRTVYIDELTPHASKSVLESAFNQFGTVKGVRFLPNYLGPKELPMGVLVEMETEAMASAVVDTVSQLPFMVAGMPRPVRAVAAKPELFHDRPKKPGRRIHCRWIDPSDPDFHKAKKAKRLAWKHTAESLFVTKTQLEEAEKLAKEQSEKKSAHHKKFELLDDIIQNGVAQKLASRFNMRYFPYR